MYIGSPLFFFNYKSIIINKLKKTKPIYTLFI